MDNLVFLETILSEPDCSSRSKFYFQIEILSQLSLIGLYRDDVTEIFSFTLDFKMLLVTVVNIFECVFVVYVPL